MTFLAMQATGEPSLFSMDTTQPPDVIGGWLICFLTLSVFSFLYRDNPFYKIAEHVFVGAGTAFFALQYYKEGIIEPIDEHLTLAFQRLDAGQLVQLGGHGVSPTLAITFRCIAAVFALMLLVRLVAPNSWAPRWPLAIMVGVYAALKMTGETQSKLVLVVKGQMKPLTNETKAAWGDAWTRIEETQVFYTFANVVLTVGLICALAHFIFTYRRTRFLSGVSRVGIVVLMITFGSMFGFTVLGRIALLIERVNQLGDYSQPAYSLAGDSGWLTTAMSPPILMGTLITLLLVLGAISRRGQGAGPGGSGP